MVGLNDFDSSMLLGFERGGEQAMAQGRLGGSGTAHKLAEGPAMLEFIDIRRPHLEEGVAKTEFEVEPRDGLERRIISILDTAPDLVFTGVFQNFHAFGLAQRKTGGGPRAVDFNLPRIPFTGGDAMGFQGPGK